MLHINFICLIILGKLWRKKVVLWLACKRWCKNNPDKRKVYRTRDYHKRGRQVYRQRHRKELAAKHRLWVCSNKSKHRAYQCSYNSKQREELTHQYVKEVIMLGSPELRGSEIPDSVIEARKEGIRAKRFIKECRRRLGIQPRRSKIPA